MKKRVNFYDDQQIDLESIQASESLIEDSLQHVINSIFFTGDNTVYGSQVRQAATAATYVEIPDGILLQSGAMIEIPVGTVETVNVLAGSGGTWGTGQAADATYPRVSIVCVKYSTKTTDSASKKFYDPGTSAEYTQAVDTRISDYYDIQVVHGTAAASPVVPTTPAGYIKLAEITVPANASTIVTANIADKRPATIATITSVNSAINTHISKVTGAHAASAISIADSGGYYTAVDVEAALAELYPKVLKLTGGTLTGNLGFSAGGLGVSFGNGGFMSDSAADTNLHANSNVWSVYTEDGATAIFVVDNAATNPKFKGYNVFHSGSVGSGSGIDAEKWMGRKFTKQSSAPTGAVAGDEWYDTSVNRWKYYNGTAWIDPMSYQ